MTLFGEFKLYAEASSCFEALFDDERHSQLDAYNWCVDNCRGTFELMCGFKNPPGMSRFSILEADGSLTSVGEWRYMAKASFSEERDAALFRIAFSG